MLKFLEALVATAMGLQNPSIKLERGLNRNRSILELHQIKNLPIESIESRPLNF